jgi:hypothetical protein
MSPKKATELLLKALVALLVVLVIAACAKDPRQYRITEANKDRFMDDLKPLKGLTVEEAGLLYSYSLRTSMGAALGQKAPSPVGKTVAELIAIERDLEEKAKKEKDDQDRLAKEAKAKEEALAAELRKAITFTVYEKSFLPSNAMSGRYQDHIVIKCAYQNSSAKRIRAFTGRVRFTDLFDKEVFASSLTITDPVNAGEKATWIGTINYNQFMEEHRRFKDAELTDLKVVWLPKQILFADGTKIGSE